jgi:hypothetical protein
VRGVSLYFVIQMYVLADGVEYEVKAENSTGELGMSEEEVFAQVSCPCRIRSFT